MQPTRRASPLLLQAFAVTAALLSTPCFANTSPRAAPEVCSPADEAFLMQVSPKSRLECLLAPIAPWASLSLLNAYSPRAVNPTRIPIGRKPQASSAQPAKPWRTREDGNKTKSKDEISDEEGIAIVMDIFGKTIKEVSPPNAPAKTGPALVNTNIDVDMANPANKQLRAALVEKAAAMSATKTQHLVYERITPLTRADFPFAPLFIALTLLAVSAVPAVGAIREAVRRPTRFGYPFPAEPA